VVAAHRLRIPEDKTETNNLRRRRNSLPRRAHLSSLQILEKCWLDWIGYPMSTYVHLLESFSLSPTLSVLTLHLFSEFKPLTLNTEFAFLTSRENLSCIFTRLPCGSGDISVAILSDNCPIGDDGSPP